LGVVDVLQFDLALCSRHVHPLLLLLLAGCSLAATSQTHIPDHKRTPGAINPKVTQENLHATVCMWGWSRTVRPPATYTNRFKAKQMRELGLPGTVHNYHEDHLGAVGLYYLSSASLRLGADPEDNKNQ
jgi:hypothetical protein